MLTLWLVYGFHWIQQKHDDKRRDPAIKIGFHNRIHHSPGPGWSYIYIYIYIPQLLCLWPCHSKCLKKVNECVHVRDFNTEFVEWRMIGHHDHDDDSASHGPRRTTMWKRFDINIYGRLSKTKSNLVHLLLSFQRLDRIQYLRSRSTCLFSSYLVLFSFDIVFRHHRVF